VSDYRCIDCDKRFEQEFDENGHACFIRCRDCDNSYLEWLDSQGQSA
jgi:DNA-directed RNA polymerase subunit RPC12/RpoP